VAEYWREGDTAWTAITLVSGTLGTWISGGFIADSYGHYELSLPNAALSSGKWVKVRLRGATNMVPVNVLIPIWSVNPQDAAAFGLSRLDVTSSSIVTTLLATSVETGIDFIEAIRVILGFAAGEVTVNTTTGEVTFTSAGGARIVITANCTINGERSDVVITP
jgi:hypothetical protein